jgi:hypothetical protein
MSVEFVNEILHREDEEDEDGVSMPLHADSFECMDFFVCKLSICEPVPLFCMSFCRYCVFVLWHPCAHVPRRDVVACLTMPGTEPEEAVKYN